MLARTKMAIIVGAVVNLWLCVETGSAKIVSQRKAIDVGETDVSLDVQKDSVGVQYRIHSEDVAPTAQCSFAFQTRPKGPFSPAVPSSEHTKPSDVAGKKVVNFLRPAALNEKSVTKTKVNWLRKDGTWAYSVEALQEPAERGPPGEVKQRAAFTPPTLRLIIPTEPVPVDEDRIGTVSGQSVVVVTLDCGGGPVVVPHVINGTTLTYNLGHHGTPGMTCIVCVKAKNQDGTVTICYEITFLARAVEQRQAKPLRKQLTVSARDLNLGQVEGNILFRYRRHDDEFAKANCICQFESRKGSFSPILPISTQVDPDATPVKSFWQVKFTKPSFLQSATKVRAKAVYLRGDGRLRYSIERTMTLEKFLEEGEPNELEKVAPPTLRLIIPVEAVDASELRTGTTNGTLQSITVDCGSGPVNVPPGNIFVTGNNFSYHFGGMGVEGKSCIVCVTVTNMDGSTTICYEITFN